MMAARSGVEYSGACASLPITPTAVCFAADGKHVYSSSRDGLARRWDIQEGKEVNRYRVQANLARFVTELPDGLLLTADSSRLVQIWDVGKGTEVRRFETDPGWLCSGRAVPG